MLDYERKCFTRRNACKRGLLQKSGVVLQSYVRKSAKNSITFLRAANRRKRSYARRVFKKYGISLFVHSHILKFIIKIALNQAYWTGLGVYDRIGRYAGAGSIVPITGFANSVTSPAIEFKTEGWIYGMAAKIAFRIAALFDCKRNCRGKHFALGFFVGAFLIHVVLQVLVGLVYFFL